MRNLKKNKRKMFYANYIAEEPVYAKDAYGNIITTDVDGVDVPVIDSYKSGYSLIEEFWANISFNSGETKITEFGLSDSAYNAIISADKGTLPFDERTLIWLEEPDYQGNSGAISESADYRVVAIKTSLNEERFILKKRVEDGATIVPSA